MRRVFILLMAFILSSPVAYAEENLEEAIFAGGCFWCMQPPFDKTEGVVKTIVGYCGGQEKNPTYKQVSAGITGHAEAIQIFYDPQRVSYEQLLDVFWRQIDPTASDRQFVDVGLQYRAAVFYLNESQRQLADASKIALNESGIFPAPIVTEISPATEFYPAEKYHQKYYRRNRFRYKFYRHGSGRDQYLDKIWGKDRKK